MKLNSEVLVQEKQRGKKVRTQNIFVRRGEIGRGIGLRIILSEGDKERKGVEQTTVCPSKRERRVKQVRRGVRSLVR